MTEAAIDVATATDFLERLAEADQFILIGIDAEDGARPDYLLAARGDLAWKLAHALSHHLPAWTTTDPAGLLNAIYDDELDFFGFLFHGQLFGGQGVESCSWGPGGVEIQTRIATVFKPTRVLTPPPLGGFRNDQ
jgi:hypothetical protein